MNLTQLCYSSARYPGITEDLVMSYSLLLSCVDLIYVNVKCMGRADLFNAACDGMFTSGFQVYLAGDFYCHLNISIN